MIFYFLKFIFNIIHQNDLKIYKKLIFLKKYFFKKTQLNKDVRLDQMLALGSQKTPDYQSRQLRKLNT
jgi:hypothetical protein